MSTFGRGFSPIFYLKTPIFKYKIRARGRAPAPEQARYGAKELYVSIKGKRKFWSFGKKRVKYQL